MAHGRPQQRPAHTAAEPVPVTQKVWVPPTSLAWELWERERDMPFARWQLLLRYSEAFVRRSREVLARLQPHIDYLVVHPGDDPPGTD